MPAWLIPALKAVLPHIGTIVSAAKPVFTKKSADATANQLQLLQQQVTELQTAAAANDAHIKSLASQVETAMKALEKAAELAETRQRLMFAMCGAALALAIAALVVAAFMR